MKPAAAQIIRAYHERSKHRLQRYAAGPETLDWDTQPDPWRRWTGAPLEPLPLPADALAATKRPRWGDLFDAGAVAPLPPSRSAVGLLFELAFAVSAWKTQGPDRWAVRCNPSSGNLHPTEAYLIAHGVTALDDGLYHYAPREHGLEHRVAGAPELPQDRPHLWVGLSSIAWREAWKYGERAFRYVQLDAGHALGALRYAAAVLGWRARRVDTIDHARLAALLGLDRDADFGGGAEREEAEVLIELLPGVAAPSPPPPPWPDATLWQGRASRIDRHPMYRWPVIDEVGAATRTDDTVADAQTATHATSAARALAPSVPHRAADALAVDLIRGRRSAQRFDARASMPRAAFERLVAALCPPALPWDLVAAPPRVQPLLFVQRVEGLASGLYALARSADALPRLRAALDPACLWQPVQGSAAPLFLLSANPALAGTMRTIDCHQALGSDAMLGLALLGEFEAAVDAAPMLYRELLQEAGLLGQVLYLEAEAAGLRGTGIGCFFDDALHELVGLRERSWQSLYHFTVGLPLSDPRIGTEPPYPERTP